MKHQTNVERLKKYLKLSELELFTVLKKELREQGRVLRTDNENYILALPKEGKQVPVLLLAHLDTKKKGDAAPQHVLYDPEYRVMWTPETLGADDRAGVYAIMELIKEHNCSVLFTTGEESGGLGAKEFVKKYPKNKWGFKVGIQLDRRNADDAVFYKNAADDFHEYIETFGFEETTGSFTDISVIGPAWKMNTVNLSIGYYNEHMTAEYLIVGNMEKTMNRVNKMLNIKWPKFEYKEEVSVLSTTGTWYNEDYWNSRKWNYTKRAYDKGTWDKVTKEYMFDGDPEDYAFNGYRGSGSSYYSSYGVQSSFADEDTPPQGDSGKKQVFSCAFCADPVDELDAIPIGPDDDPESATYGVELVICDDCFFANDGFYCLECWDPVVPALHSDYLSAAELEVCDRCYRKILGSEADEAEDDYRKELEASEPAVSY